MNIESRITSIRKKFNEMKMEITLLRLENEKLRKRERFMKNPLYRRKFKSTKQ